MPGTQVKDLPTIGGGGLNKNTQILCSNNGTTVSTTTLENARVVIETYQNGANWYRVWSDGWIEQGGFLISNGDTNWKTTTFLINFKDLFYTVTLSGVQLVNAQAGTSNGIINRARSSTSGFDWYWTASPSYGIFWTACGY